jgi:hypothetical protein
VSIRTYVTDNGCNPPSDFCTENYHGTGDGGIIVFTSSAQAGTFTFTGSDTDGSFSGSLFCEFAFSCMPPFNVDGWGNSMGFSFTASNWRHDGVPLPWFTRGEFSGGGGCCFDGMLPTSVTLTMTTTVIPEPSTFMMLGAGLLPVLGVTRRRYVNR